MRASPSFRASMAMAVARSPHLLHPPLHPPRRHFSHSNSDLSTFKTSSKGSILRTHIPTSPSTVAVRGNARWACCCLAGSKPLSSSSRRLPMWVSGVWGQCVKFAVPGALAVALSLSGLGIAEAKVGVNKPQLLPKDFTPLIDVAGFLSPSQERKLIQEIIDIEKDTGFKLRVLAQNYPDTPGLAVRDFWQVDDRTIVFVADPTFGNILNFNVGALVDLDIPRSFWSRLSGKYGNMFYWKEKGEDASIEAAVMAISSCLREPVGPSNCIDVK